MGNDRIAIRVLKRELAAKPAVAQGLDDGTARRDDLVVERISVVPTDDDKNRQLIGRQHRPTNARVLEASITGDGRSRLARAHTLVADIESTMKAGMGASEAKALQRHLATIAENLEGS